MSGYDLILKETDPKLVKFQIDCGWMIFAGLIISFLLVASAVVLFAMYYVAA